MKNAFTLQQFLIILATAILSAVVSVFIYSRFDRNVPAYLPSVQPAAKPLPIANKRVMDSLAIDDIIPTADFVTTSSSVTPAVVNIQSTPYRFEFWSNSSSGSGVIISPDGYIVTNNHVIEQGGKITVTLSDRREYEASKIGTDPSTDLAILKIEANKLPWLQLGNSDSLKVGAWVLAVGNPFNLESTVTAGIVSAKGRSIDILNDKYSVESFIQTDAMVNPGNSGGALVNRRGELIGINTAIITRSGHYEGYSFAVPSNLAQKVINDIIIHGSVQRGILGINIQQVDDELAKKIGLEKVEGIYIEETSKGGGAANAGMRKGDVIVGVNGVKTRTVPELQEQVARFSPNDKMNIQYIRRGQLQTSEVTLQRKASTGVDEVDLSELQSEPLRQVGFELRELLSSEKERLDIEHGIKVISIYKNSLIEDTNMDIGFVILKVNDQIVNTVEEVELALELAGREITLEGIYEKYTGEYVYKFSREMQY